MKKTIYFLIALSFVLVLSSAFENTKWANTTFLSLNEGPVLPNQTLRYTFQLPEHILNTEDTTVIGYEIGDIDTTILPLITDPGATLGRVLFYDKKLSALENISCGSCHLQSRSFADDKSFSQGVSQPTKRNSMALNDLGWTNNGLFFWDMKTDDLHNTIRLPLKDENEIGAELPEIVLKLENTEYYPALFESAYGSEEVTEDKIVDALVQFIASMNSFNSKFDEGVKSKFQNFTDQENMGKELFGINCSICHSEGKFPTSLFVPPNEIPPFELPLTFPFLFNNGMGHDLADLGMGEWQSGSEGLFKLPTLRNIALTGPYMHDGRFNTLDEVIDFYSDETHEGVHGSFVPSEGYNFTQTQKDALKAFLETLTDESFAKEEKWSDPFDIAIGNEELSFDVLIKPNPMTQRAEIVVNDTQGVRKDVKIYNMSGQLIKSDYFVNESYILEKREYPVGSYVINLIQGNKMGSYRMIVQ